MVRYTARMVAPEQAYVASRRDPAECWPWQGSINPNKRQGYGIARRDGKLTYAHRLVWEWERGPIPEGMEIDHLCRNRVCVNPDHLEAVTTHENMIRMLEYIRSMPCKYGHPASERKVLFRRSESRSDKFNTYCGACNRERCRFRYRAKTSQAKEESA